MAEITFYTNPQFDGLAKWMAGDSDIVVLMDENTEKDCYPILGKSLMGHYFIRIRAGEEHKTLQTCTHIWSELTRISADKETLLINLGGGVIGDIGGFAAACYKRGISFINIPTTLLAMVDASVGGKTAIDFEGFKNQIGLFAEPEAIYIYTGFLKTLPQRELLSGFAEVVKHYLIADKESFAALAQLNKSLVPENWDDIVRKNIAIKQSFVERDPHEKSIRRALNFGHTIGHAVESYFLKTPDKKLLHGEAIAAGMLAESFISMKNGKLALQDLTSISQVLLYYYKLPLIPDGASAEILKLMQHDKKNLGGAYQFTLLDGIGNFSINNAVEDSLVMEALQYYNSQLV